MNYRSLLLAFLLAAAHCHLLAQRRTLPEDANLSLAECLTIDMDSAVFSPVASRPFSTIVVTDERFDRMKIGYFYTPRINRLLKMCMKENTVKEVNIFLNNYFSAVPSPATDSVFACLKKLWIKNDDPYTDPEDSKTYSYSLQLKIEFYLKRASCFYPLYRFDSTLSLKGTSEKIPGMLIRQGLIASVRKLSSTHFSEKRPQCLSFRQIDSFNRTTRNIPILKGGYVKGVYLTFSQFKNNRPAFEDYRIRFEERSDFLSVTGKVIRDSVLNDVWGFSDGTTMFIRNGRNFFPLFRAGDNFEFYAFNEITIDRPYGYTPSYRPNDNAGNIVTNGVGLLLNSSTTKSSDIKLYRLDIETGKIY